MPRVGDGCVATSRNWGIPVIVELSAVGSSHLVVHLKPGRGTRGMVGYVGADHPDVLAPERRAMCVLDKNFQAPRSRCPARARLLHLGQFVAASLRVLLHFLDGPVLDCAS